MGELEKKQERLLRRIKRVRKKIFGTSERPRLAITRSNRHIYAQLIDDIAGKSLGLVSTTSKSIREKLNSCKNREAASLLAESLFELCKKKKINKVVLDRRGRKYHIVLKTFADKLREKGIKF